jgi:Flp pilus assembly protein TadB
MAMISSFGITGANKSSRGRSYLEEFEEDDDLKTARFFTVARKKGLDVALKHAKLNITKKTFLTQASMAFIAAFFLGWFLMGTIYIGIVMGGLVVVFFYQMLVNRRDKMKLEVEQAVVDYANSIVAGVQTHSVLRLAMEDANKTAPKILKNDLEKAFTRWETGATFLEAHNWMVEKHESDSLQLLVKVLDAVNSVGSADTIKEVIYPLKNTVRNMLNKTKMMRAELTMQILNLRITSFFPIVMVIFVRLAMPSIGAYYATFLGFIFQATGVLLGAATYFIGMHIANQVIQTVQVNRRVEFKLDSKGESK